MWKVENGIPKVIRRRRTSYSRRVESWARRRNLRVGSVGALGARDVVIDVALGAGRDVDELELASRI